MQFFPTLADLEVAVMFPLHSLATDTLQSFPLIQAILGYLTGVVCVTNRQIGWVNSLTNLRISCTVLFVVVRLDGQVCIYMYMYMY